MKVVPVIDILNGVAVNAIRGKRNKYQPLISSLSDSDQPLSVATAFKSCGFDQLYVADLDSIMQKGENFATIQQIAEKTGMMLMVDAGVSNVEKAQRLLKCKVDKVIVGTETLPSIVNLVEILQAIGREKVVVSLDLRNRNVISKSLTISSQDAATFAQKLEKYGVDEIIVLDIARVGTREGVDIMLLKNIMQKLKVKVDAGGGIRSINDLTRLDILGVHSALVATSLHSEKISIDELRQAGFIN